MTGCSSPNISTVSSPYTLSSVQRPFLSMTWIDLFAHTEELYLVYVYSDTCMHCLSIKDQIEEFADTSIIPFYFVQYTDEIPIGTNVEITIGVTSVEECFIKGTPTLILIENGAVSFNIAGTEIILETIDLYKK